LRRRRIEKESKPVAWVGDEVGKYEGRQAGRQAGSRKFCYIICKKIL